MKDYYKILGINKNASLDETKKAYRTLAKKYHPDVCKEPDAELKFKEIQEAYDVLSNPETRERYDNPQPFRGFAFPFGMDDPFGVMDSFMRKERTRVFSTIQTQMEVDYLDMILGGEKIITIDGETVALKIPELSPNGLTLHLSRNNKEIYITLRARLPRAITPEVKKTLESLRNKK
jgi:DnaJ-class molecular chaperone